MGSKSVAWKMFCDPIDKTKATLPACYDMEESIIFFTTKKALAWLTMEH